jgi:epoxyqueuosine reductase
VLDQLQRWLGEQGYAGGILPSQHLADLREDIDARHGAGLLDEDLYHEYLASFDVEPPETPFRTSSIIAVAVPDPPRRITFARQGEPIPTIVPPTYLHWRELDKHVEEGVAEILGPMGHQVTLANLPKKLTAVRSGMAAYGRNNITYVPGMGSFHRLVVLWSDLPYDEDEWQELRMMEACDECRACQRACPTSAIDPDRFLLHAERCLTFLNEKPSEIPFPEWIDPSWHNCLVGCLRCQRVCPANKEVRDWVEGDEEFSEQETTLLLDGVDQERLAPETLAKLERLDLTDLLEVLPRNLKALLTA